MGASLMKHSKNQKNDNHHGEGEESFKDSIKEKDDDKEEDKQEVEKSY